MQPVKTNVQTTYLVNCSNNLEKFIIRQVLQGEFPLARVTGIRLPQDGMSVTRDYLIQKAARP